MKIDTIGGRRWIGFLSLCALSTGLLVYGHFESPGAQRWVDMMVWLYGIFAGVNVIQRGVEAVRDIKSPSK